MKINIKETIKDYEGKPVKEGEKGKEEEVTWRSIAYLALNNVIKDELLTAEDRGKCYQITSKLYANREPDLTISEIAFILARIQKFFVNNPLVCGRAEEFFNATSTSK